MSQLARELRHALRTLARNPGFAALAVATLGLGIGVNVAIFSAVDAVLRRPLADAVATLDPSLPLFHVRTLEEKLGLAMGQARTREFGIRLALGAQAGSLRRLVLSRGVRLALIGSAAGLAAAAAISGLADQLLYGVSPLDPISFLAAGVILATAVLAASAVPAERAARVDPMTALRSD